MCTLLNGLGWLIISGFIKQL